MATLNACEEIRRRLAPIAAKMTSPTFKEVVLSAYYQRVDLSAHGFYIVPTDRCGYDWNFPIPEGSPAAKDDSDASTDLWGCQERRTRRGGRLSTTSARVLR
jgi:hypothetical protein